MTDRAKQSETDRAKRTGRDRARLSKPEQSIAERTEQARTFAYILRHLPATINLYILQ